MEGLVFGLKLGSLIPLIPPFYCQLFPSYRRSRTEFRICATVHRSNLRPTDAALLFLSAHQYRRGPAPRTWPRPATSAAASTPHPPQYSILHLFLSPQCSLAGIQVQLDCILRRERTTGAWRCTPGLEGGCGGGGEKRKGGVKKADTDFAYSHETRGGCGPLS